MTVRVDRLAAAAPEGYTLATEVAEWLVRTGVPFRDAHEVAGELVRLLRAAGQELTDLDDAELAGVDPRLTPEVRAVLDVPGALRARSAPGGTAPARVAEQLAALEEAVRGHRAWAAASVVPVGEGR